MAVTRPRIVPLWAENAGVSDLLKPADAAIQAGWTNTGAATSRLTWNWAMKYFGNAIRYVTRRGFSDWSSTETYLAGDIVRSSDGNVYSVTGVPTVGLAPHLHLAAWTLLWASLASLTSPVFGDGSDADLTVAQGQTVTLTAVTKQYNNVTVMGGGVLQSLRSVIKVKGTLTIANGGLLHSNGAPGVGILGGIGTDGVGGSITSPCPVGGGTSGGNGGQVLSAGQTGFPGADFAAVSASTGLQRNAELAYAGYTGAGGAGGAGYGQGNVYDQQQFPGGVAGCVGASASDLIALDLLPLGLWTPGSVSRVRYVNYGASDVGGFAERVPLRGGGGGGGGGDNQVSVLAGNGQFSPDNYLFYGGGGGAGGGVVLVLASKIVLGSTTCVQALGGNGAHGLHANNLNGCGGGGAGGRVVIFHGGITGALDNAVVAGGLAGGGANEDAVVRGLPGAAGVMTIRKVI